MNILVVYCHPSKNSFTHAVKESFVKGLEDAGYSYEISDLYAENFCPVMSEDEYVREGFYQMDRPVKEDVLREQEKINRTDIIVFIYPDFWTASPAMLEGWFQRVWTYGFAYGDFHPAFEGEVELCHSLASNSDSPPLKSVLELVSRHLDVFHKIFEQRRIVCNFMIGVVRGPVVVVCLFHSSVFYLCVSSCEAFIMR